MLYRVTVLVVAVRITTALNYLSTSVYDSNFFSGNITCWEFKPTNLFRWQHADTSVSLPTLVIDYVIHLVSMMSGNERPIRTDS
jgi:hypothetical protein